MNQAHARFASRMIGIKFLAVAAVPLMGAFAPEVLASSAERSSTAPTPSAEMAADQSVLADMVLLTVDKRTLTADLETWPEDPKKAMRLKSFRIAIGKNEGDKEFEGDNKTPEGIYFAQNQIDGAGLPQKYGARAIPIDFPNPLDVIAGKTGHGIWLHGVDRDERIEEAKVTEGCVAFYNTDIQSLSTWLKSHQGAVVIAKDRGEVNRAADIAGVKEETLGWMKSWIERQVDTYMSFYAPQFRFANFDLAGYRDYKRRVFASYKKMDVTFDNLRIVTHPKYAVSFFNQDFQGDNRYRSVGRKILYWGRKPEGGWAIQREVFQNRRFEHVVFTNAELSALSASTVRVGTGDKLPQNPKL